MRCEYDRIGVRQCGAGRRRTSCGDNSTALSYWYWVTWRSATWMLNGLPTHTTVEIKIFHGGQAGRTAGFVRTTELNVIFQLYHFGYEDLPLRPLRTSAFLRKHGMRELPPPRRLPAGPAAGRLVGPGWHRQLALSAGRVRPRADTGSVRTTQLKRSATGRCRPRTTTRSARHAESRG